MGDEPRIDVAWIGIAALNEYPLVCHHFCHRNRGHFIVLGRGLKQLGYYLFQTFLVGAIEQASVRDNLFGRHDPALLVLDLDCRHGIAVSHEVLLSEMCVD